MLFRVSSRLRGTKTYTSWLSFVPSCRVWFITTEMLAMDMSFWHCGKENSSSPRLFKCSLIYGSLAIGMTKFSFTRLIN